MSILDEFLILIKSNSKDVEKDMDSLDRKVKQTQDDIDKTDKKTKELGLSFGDLVKSFVAADAITGFFDGIKNFALNVGDYENKLWRLSKVTRQNVADLDAWDQTFQEFGAPAGTFLSVVEQVNQELAKAGVGGPESFEILKQKIKEVSHAYKDANVQQREFAFQNRLGLSFSAAESLAIIPDNKLQETVDKWKGARDLTQDNAEEIHKYMVAVQELDAVWMKLFNDIFPYLDKLLKYMDNLLNRTSPGIQGGQPGKAKGFWGIVGELVPPSASSVGRQESQDFWLSQGYSSAAVSSLLANEGLESGFNASAVGDKGTSFGIFQWHDPARRAAILQATGIDVTTASHADQLRAAAWELQNLGYADRLKAAGSTGQRSEILTQYENPADKAKRMSLLNQYSDQYLAAMNSISAADSSPLNSMSGGGDKTVNVSVGNVTINTQATDAQGIAVDFASQLHAHMRNAAGFFDDATLY